MHRETSGICEARSSKIFEYDVVRETEQDTPTSHFVVCVVGVATLSLHCFFRHAIDERSTAETKDFMKIRCVAVCVVVTHVCVVSSA